MQQVSDNGYAVLNEKNRVCDANSELINRGGGVVLDTHEDGDHVWGNQLVEGAEIITHRSIPERMKQVMRASPPLWKLSRLPLLYSANRTIQASKVHLSPCPDPVTPTRHRTPFLPPGPPDAVPHDLRR
jgi:glyoxylase-like metal-dependent hydrolase (beta-lactamase superfamily II)